MTDNASTPTDAQPDDKVQQLEQRVAELESMTEIGDEDGDGWSIGDLLDLGLTRRQGLTALALLGAGYALGPAIAKALSEPAAASHGGASLGTAQNPLQEIYVHDLYNETDNIVADSVSTDVAGLTEQSSAPTGETGVRKLFADSSDGSVKKVNPDGSTESLGGISDLDMGTI